MRFGGWVRCGLLGLICVGLGGGDGEVCAQETTTRVKVGPEVSLDDSALLARIRERMVEKEVVKAGEMTDYREMIPKSGVEFEMVAIPGGEFSMGSPEDEPDRLEDEGPQRKVNLSPFWMGKCEVTWDEYEPFMMTEVRREKHGGWRDFDPAVHDAVDGVSQPTPPYTEMSFGMGQSGYPAICMTQHAANKYCQWLSAQTGHFYRLPTEAEWEYACRAGTTSAYSFGEDAMEEYAWFYDNSNDKYQKVGTKKPNPWGLHDMHGNVSEWTADAYGESYPVPDDGGVLINPWTVPERLYPRVVRGGSWYDDPDRLRSAARLGSSEDWKQQDPQLPKSLWYHTDATWVGFRVVRPVEIPTVEEMDAHWNSARGKR
ncbi:formylglycine-generating enzyme family protein [Rhodopirellula sp. JC740]|uniref:Formylglycine-generating enzyme family protein n=1 Tax=Rhodopirellula halodulae TaxID=2894198 RepID=A0ABS8NGM5_9BACT|nr:formylglycine-generating enzyme family protein [Rhodopirellula sp. JC740]MCC9642704.1 formylglycine-generating enzyme family protein [Rhodopirellula sp. JC740]